MTRKYSSAKRIISLAVTLIMLFSVVSMGIMQTTAEGETCDIKIDKVSSGYFYCTYDTAAGHVENKRYSNPTTLKGVLVGTEVTLVAEERYTEANPSSTGRVAPFVCWQTDKKRIITMDEEYTFTALASKSVEVVFAQHPIGQYTVRYVNNAGLLIYACTVPTGSSPEDTDPEGFFETYKTPVLPGYEFLGWDQQPDDYKNSTSFVIVRPRYSVLPVSYTLDITNETGVSGAKTYDAFSKAAAFASSYNTEGKKFLYWKDAATDEILCYNPLFLFYITRNTTLTAVYGDEAVSGKVCVRIANCVKDVAKGTITFYSERSVSADLEVIETGILLSSYAVNENQFVITNTALSKGTSISTANSGLYSLTQKRVSVDDTYYTRAYVAYRDASGTINVAYSSIYSDTI